MKTAAAQMFKARLVVGLLTIVSLTVLSSGQAAAQGVIRINFCPFVITAPGQYLVTQDLVCPVGHGIQIESSDVKLNLGGHTITGTARSGGGIFVGSSNFSTLTNVEVRNGTIRNFSAGIAFRLVNESRIEAITSTANSFGLQLGNAHDNTITSSEFSDNVDGIEINGSIGNVFRGNKVTGNLQVGYFLLGGSNNNLITSTTASASLITGNQTHGVIISSGANGNTVQGSQVLGNVNFGILSVGANNTVRSNTVNENGRGITLTLGATANNIVSNTALRNVILDLEDQNPNCDANVWQHNNFNTANQPQCID